MKVLDIIWAIITFLWKLFTNKKEENVDEKRLELDRQLAECIKKNDADCVARIREMLKNYKTLILIIACGLLMSGCGLFRPSYKDVPLVQSGVPYVLPPGTYKDINKISHTETNVRWSLSQEDLYNNTRQIRDVKEPGKIQQILKEYLPYFIAILALALAFKRLNINRGEKL